MEMQGSEEAVCARLTWSLIRQGEFTRRLQPATTGKQGWDLF